MTGILTAVSGQFSKALILGSLLPAAIFVMFTLLVVQPFFPTQIPLIGPLTGLGTAWQAAAFAAIALVIATLLYNFNVPIIQLYEGYPWRQWLPGRLLTGRYLRRFAVLRTQWDELAKVHYAIEGVNASDGRLTAVDSHRADAGRTLFSELPDHPDTVMPTRLGNVIRSFESYPERQYGMSAIPLWIRLIGKMSADYASAIDAAKTPFDFMLNMSFLSVCFALLVAVLALLFPANLPDTEAWLSIGIACVAALLLAWLFYQLSIGQAAAWGDMVKGAFDLFRWNLLKELGYHQMPATPREENDLWSAVSQAIVFGPSPYEPPAPYGRPTTYTEATPPTVTLQTVRAIDPPPKTGPDAVLRIVLRVQNVDGDGGLAQDVAVTDTLPDGYALVWDSVDSDSPSLEVSGANPYRFEIGDLRPGDARTVRYRAVPLP